MLLLISLKPSRLMSRMTSICTCEVDHMYDEMILSCLYDLFFPLFSKLKIVVFMFSKDIADG